MVAPVSLTPHVFHGRTNNLKTTPSGQHPRSPSRIDETARDFSKVFCTMLAKDFTKTLEPETFEMEMFYELYLPEILGEALAHSPVGEKLAQSATEKLNGHSHGKNGDTLSFAKGITSTSFNEEEIFDVMENKP